MRLILEQTADRVSHRIQVLNSASQVLAELHSIEGTSADEWPPSPALQSCSVQEIRPGQPAAFLVGMSGKSHWSASIEPKPGAGEIFFDFAGRVNSVPQWLGSSYSAGATSLEYTVGFQRSSLDIAIQTTASADRIPLLGSLPSMEPLKCACPETVPNKFPVTMRWQYRIYLL